MTEKKHYGVWMIPDKESTWFVNGATGIIFSTPNVDLASAQAMALKAWGGKAMQIGPRGKPLPIDEQEG